MEKVLTKNEVLKNLRKTLRGHYPTIARECGVTVGMVSHVLMGRSSSDEIMNKAIEIKDNIVSKNNDILQRASKGL